MPLITSKQIWTQQPQTRQQLDPRFSDRLIALVVPGQPEYFGGGAPIITGVGKIEPAKAGVSAKAVYNGAGANEVKWPVNLSFSGDYTISVFSSNEDQFADLETFYTSGSTSNFIAHGATIARALVDYNFTPSLSVSITSVPRFISARRRSNQASIVVDKTASSENVTGTRDQAWTYLNVGRDGASNSVPTKNYLIAIWNRYVINEDLFYLSENPRKIIKKQDKRIWIPVAAGGVTITCTPGSATTAGISAGISAATVIACNVGTATTAGISAGISSATTISCNAGTASTAGISAGITQATTIACNAGTATVAGISAGISLNSSITISCNVGNATTAGVSAVFPQTISCTTGNATTAGVVAAFPQKLICNVGNATTAGITAQVDISGTIVIGCNVGTAETAGIAAGISIAFILACNVGTATTIGATAYFPQSLQCSPGNAIAVGIDATFTVAGPTTIVCNVGNATASGISFSFGGTLVDAPNGSGPAIIIPRGTRGAVQNTTRPPNIGGIRI